MGLYPLMNRTTQELAEGCNYYGLIGGLSGTSAIMTITMMAIERHMCITRPLDPSSRMTRNRALIMALSIWLYSAVFSFAPLFGLNRYVPEGFLTSCSFDYLTDELSSKIFIVTFFVAAWCVPMIIICRCYVGIVLSVHQNQKIFLHHTQDNIPDRNVDNQKRLEIKLAKISFALISMWTISWTPYAVVALLGLFSNRSLLTPFGSMVPALICKLASMFDPFIYGLSNRQFKEELVNKLLTNCKSRKLRNRQQVSSLIRRSMSIRSQDYANMEDVVDDSCSIEQCETAFNGGETFVSKVVVSDPGGAAKGENNETTSRTFLAFQTSMSDSKLSDPKFRLTVMS
ncbi:rhodopsin [Trichonephila clavipes]|nr:rhodopsin [Trichonephila clavipes]